MVKYQNYFSIIFLLNLSMRDFLHKVKKKISHNHLIYVYMLFAS